MLRLGHTTAKVLGTSSFRAGSSVSVTHCDALSQGTGVNCWECQIRRVNDELKEISVLLLNPLITWVITVGVENSNAVIIFFQAVNSFVYIYIFFCVHAHRYIFSFQQCWDMK